MHTHINTEPYSAFVVVQGDPGGSQAGDKGDDVRNHLTFDSYALMFSTMHVCVMCMLMDVCVCVFNVWLHLFYNSSKGSQTFSSVFQGEQGLPGPQGPEEVVEFPPEFLPPKGEKVKAKHLFVFPQDF